MNLTSVPREGLFEEYANICTSFLICFGRDFDDVADGIDTRMKMKIKKTHILTDTLSLFFSPLCETESVLN